MLSHSEEDRRSVKYEEKTSTTSKYFNVHDYSFSEILGGNCNRAQFCSPYNVMCIYIYIKTSRCITSPFTFYRTLSHLIKDVPSTNIASSCLVWRSGKIISLVGFAWYGKRSIVHSSPRLRRNCWHVVFLFVCAMREKQKCNGTSPH